ncbi:MAG TPA: hypothetical protein VI037_00955 [Nitrososphaera sp.]|jgi:hypothetical protein
MVLVKHLQTQAYARVRLPKKGSENNTKKESGSQRQFDDIHVIYSALDKTRHYKR